VQGRGGREQQMQPLIEECAKLSDRVLMVSVIRGRVGTVGPCPRCHFWHSICPGSSGFGGDPPELGRDPDADIPIA
jgi:hypothetical protein